MTPSASWILGLKVGDVAPDCFRGSRRIVDRIAYRGVDIHGRMYVGVYLQHGAGCISESYKAGERHVTVFPIGADPDFQAVVEGRADKHSIA